VDTASGKVVFCKAVPEGAVFVALRRAKVYLCTRSAVAKGYGGTSRGALPQQGLNLPAMCHRTLIFHKIQDNNRKRSEN